MGRWFGSQRFEPTERVPYREGWARLLSRVNVALFLASELADMIQGQTIVVDGGTSLHA